MADFIIALIKGIAGFFINPIFYLLVIGLLLFSARRVRSERLSFRIKAYGMFNTVFSSLIPSLIAGLCLSLVFIITGVALKPGVLVLLSACYLLLLLTGQIALLSPAIAGGLTAVIAYFCPIFLTPYSWLNSWIRDIHSIDYLSLGCFLSAVLLAECLLVFLRGSYQSSPRLVKSRRSGRFGAHEASQLWIVPVLLLVPSIGNAGPIGAWPFFPGAGASFGFLFFPVGIGLSQLITHTLPERAVRVTGRWLLAIAGVMIICTGLDFWLNQPLLIVGGSLAALAARLLLLYVFHLQKKLPHYFTQPNQGLRVVGVIPHSPSDRMGILPGDEITEVNDQPVRSGYEFYQALQRQPAYCKLEVIDPAGEIRFVKAAIHEGDGHKIGILFWESDLWNADKKTEA